MTPPQRNCGRDLPSYLLVSRLFNLFCSGLEPPVPRLWINQPRPDKLPLLSKGEGITGEDTEVAGEETNPGLDPCGWSFDQLALEVSSSNESHRGVLSAACNTSPDRRAEPDTGLSPVSIPVVHLLELSGRLMQ